MNRCCCFSDSQHSSYASGIYTIILSACGIAYLASIIGYINYNSHHEVGNHFEYKIGSISALVITALVIFALLLIFSLKLLYGIQTGNRLMFVPWMVCIIIIIILQGAAIIMYLVNVYDITNPRQLCILMIKISMLGLHVSIYFAVFYE